MFSVLDVIAVEKFNLEGLWGEVPQPGTEGQYATANNGDGTYHTLFLFI